MPGGSTKQQLDKQAWAWAETVEPDQVGQEHVEAAYRLDLPPCVKGFCRRNCKAKPRCYNALGQNRWQGEFDDKDWYEIDDPNDEVRPKGEYAGLKNLGATCYVNTYLQLWFHTPAFRAAIYNYEEPLDPEKKDPRLELQAPSVEVISSGTTIITVSSSTSNEREDRPEQQPSVISISSTSSSGVAVSSSSSSATTASSSHSAMSVAMETFLTPATVAGHLQQIFAQLEFSRRRHIDPTPFINSLGLDAALQQDAQEFSKLLMSVLEMELSMKELIQQQYLGYYCYVTRCAGCGGESRRPSEFYELDLNIRGHKDLFQCIDEFLEEEKLEGDNQYECERCGGKQNAARYIRLQTLPPVLNLQLLRFVFDRTTGHKKKLSSYLQFPETIDMSKYLDKPAGTHEYELTAVLIHRGPSAYSGHYIAHIRTVQDAWHKFNDEEVEQMSGGRKLTLGGEDDVQGKDSKKPKTSKGQHASRNAYMLVYTAKPVQHETEKREFSSLSQQLQTFIEYDNQKFEDWISDMNKLRERNVEKGRKRQKEILDHFDMMHQHADEAIADNGEWLPIAWITDWTGQDNADKVSTIKTGPLMCSHGRLSPDKATAAKYLPTVVTDMLWAAYGSSRYVRLQDNPSLCWECVRERCRVIRTRARMEEDQKAISAMCKRSANSIADETGKCYWVGKASLRSWKRLATEAAAAENGADKTDEQTADDKQANDMTPSSSNGDVAENNDYVDDDDEDEVKFNEDIVCKEHGELVLEPGPRRLVTEDVWRRLRMYFPTAPEFPEATAQPCEQCQSAREAERSALEAHRASAAEQRQALADLFLDRRRPPWPPTTPTPSATEVAERCSPASALSSASSADFVTPSTSESDLTSGAGVATDKNLSACGTSTTSSVSTTNSTVFSSASGGVIGQVCARIMAEVGGVVRTAADNKDKSSKMNGSCDVDLKTVSSSDTAVVMNKTSADSSLLNKLKRSMSSVSEGSGGLKRLATIVATDTAIGEVPPADSHGQSEDSTSTAFMSAMEEDVKSSLAVSNSDKTLASSSEDAKVTLSDHTLSSTVYVVPAEWVSEWRKFIRDPVRHAPISTINNSAVFLCPHEGFLVQPETLVLDTAAQRLVLLSPAEWSALTRYVTVDVPISMTRVTHRGSGCITFTTNPPVCDSCCRARLLADEAAMFTYSLASIYVRKVSAPTSGGDSETPSSSANSHGAQVAPPGEEGAADADADYQVDAKRRRLDISTATMVANDNNAKRRSTRRRRVRGEKEVEVASTDTFRNLKIQIMKLFSVPPYDQNLWMDGKLLTGDGSATLASLRIPPGATLYLKADEPQGDDPAFMEDLDSQPPRTEEGFKGTGLLGATTL